MNPKNLAQRIRSAIWETYPQDYRVSRNELDQILKELESEESKVENLLQTIETDGMEVTEIKECLRDILK